LPKPLMDLQMRYGSQYCCDSHFRKVVLRAKDFSGFT
jgi:hypothetical protein